MNEGRRYINDRARLAGAAYLRNAAAFVRLHATTPLFQKRMGKGASAVVVRIDLPGVLSVLDPSTGELLAVSEVGRLETLVANFSRDRD